MITTIIMIYTSDTVKVILMLLLYIKHTINYYMPNELMKQNARSEETRRAHLPDDDAVTADDGWAGLALTTSGQRGDVILRVEGGQCLNRRRHSGHPGQTRPDQTPATSVSVGEHKMLTTLNHLPLLPASRSPALSAPVTDTQRHRPASTVSHLFSLFGASLFCRWIHFHRLIFFFFKYLIFCRFLQPPRAEILEQAVTSHEDVRLDADWKEDPKVVSDWREALQRRR